MIEWAVLGAVAVGAGGFVYRVVRRGKVHDRWKAILDEAAKLVDGRPSAGSRYDDPEFRAEIDGVTVTLKLVGVEKPERDGRVVATAELPDADDMQRLYFGWDVLETPQSVAHVDEVPYPPVQRVEGTVKVRADDATLADHFMKAAIVDLIDVRREADAHALEVIVKGGYLTLVLHGLTTSPVLLERAVRVAVRLGRTITADRSEAAPASAPAAPKAAGPCALCDGEDVEVTCRGCDRAYHAACFEQATACLECGGTAVVRLDR